MANEDDFYDVGYCKPPKSGQFTKGVSGNPKGRPKGSKNLFTVVLKQAHEKVRINGPTGSRLVTKVEAATMQLWNKAAQGELPAAREAFGLIQKSEMEQGSIATRKSYQEADQRTLENLRRRFANLSTPRTSPPTTDSGEDSK